MKGSARGYNEGPLHAHEGQIGVVFALGEMSVALATLAVPILAVRMLKVDGLLLVVFSLSHIGRATTFRMSGPLDDAFNMEVLDARERATNTGIEIAVGSALSAIAISVSSRLMNAGDFTTPFLILAASYLVSTVIYWWAFRPLETRGAMRGESLSSLAATA